MVLVLQLYDGYRGSILGFAREKVLSVEQIALVPPIIVSTEFSVLPGFAPAAELVAWRVPKGASVVDLAKGPKTIDAPSGLIEADGRQPAEGGPTRSAQTRPAS
jgi:hypothetical protein